MKPLFWTALIVPFCFSVAHANTFVSEIKEVKQVCFGREYTERELSINTGQTAKMVRIQLLPEANAEHVKMFIFLTLKRNVKTGQENTPAFSNHKVEMRCDTYAAHSGRLLCQSVCDEGRAFIVWDRASIAYNSVTLVNLGFILNNNNCKIEPGFRTVRNENAPREYFHGFPGNQRFTLYALPESFCE